MDYRELNAHVDAFTADADVCASKLRECCQMGSNVSLLDLRKEYLQVRVSETMWPFQTVVFELNVWVDASSLAIGVLLEKNGAAIEDACWLRPTNDAAHINLAELDAVMKGCQPGTPVESQEITHTH